MSDLMRSMDKSLLSIGTKRAAKNGYGDIAQYMMYAESNHPAEVILHVIREMAAKRRNQ